MIVIAGLLVRILVAALYQHITVYPDSEGYIALAERLLNFDLSEYEGERSPGYPLLLCLSGISDIATVIFQNIIGVCTLVFVYKILLQTGIGRKISLIAVLGLTCYFPVVFFEFTILTETLTLFIITLLFYHFFKIVLGRDVNLNSVLWLVLLCSYLVLVKMFYIFLAILLFVVLVSCGSRSIKVVLSRYIYVLLIPLFVFLGWSYVNKQNTGYFVPTTFYGFNMAQNCVLFADKTTPEYSEIGYIYAKYKDNSNTDKEIAMAVWEAYPELQERTGLSFPDLSKKMYDYSIATIKKNPVKYLKQVFVSWCDFWKTSLYWERYNFAMPQASDAMFYICYAERIVLQLVKILFVILIPYNVVLAFRRKGINAQTIISIVVLTASVLQAFATYGTNSRFSCPFEMMMVVSILINMSEFRRYRVEQKTAS